MVLKVVVTKSMSCVISKEKYMDIPYFVAIPGLSHPRKEKVAT